MSKPDAVSHERLTSILEYFPLTGKFVWKESLSIRAPVGAEAGWKMIKGYISIGIDGVDYLAHRLAWFYVHGEWPISQIDHINEIKDDNSLANLRQATNSGNAVNKKQARSDNKSGHAGVHFDKSRQKWMVTVGKKSCGRFDCKIEAIAHRRSIVETTYGEFSPYRRPLDE